MKKIKNKQTYYQIILEDKEAALLVDLLLMEIKFLRYDMTDNQKYDLMLRLHSIKRKISEARSCSI